MKSEQPNGLQTATNKAVPDEWVTGMPLPHNEIRTAKWIANGNEQREIGLSIHGAAQHIDNVPEYQKQSRKFITQPNRIQNELEDIDEEAKQCIITWPEAWELIKTIHGLQLFCKHTTNQQYLRQAQTKLFLMQQ